MAVGVLMTMPGIKQEQYEQINEKLFGHYPFDAKDAPDGLIMHSAGPSPEGWYVYDIWETKGHYTRFGKGRLEPAVRETVGSDVASGRPEFYEIANLVGVGGKGPVGLTSMLAVGA